VKTIEVNLFEYSELSKESQEKALANYYLENPIEFSNELYEFILEKLEENNIGIRTIGNEKDFKFYCSLSYCQGDGLCFIGSFYFKNNSNVIYTLKHEGQYFYATSVSFYVLNWNNNKEAYFDFSEGGKFNKIYLDICKQAEKFGYELLEETPEGIEEGTLFYANGDLYKD
jgi:hypothetical protein